MEANNCWEQMSEGCKAAVARMLGFFPVSVQQSAWFRIQLEEMPSLAVGAKCGDFYRAYLVRAYRLSWGCDQSEVDGLASRVGVKHE